MRIKILKVFEIIKVCNQQLSNINIIKKSILKPVNEFKQNASHMPFTAIPLTNDKYLNKR
jgi:hypothetical protein